MSQRYPLLLDLAGRLVVVVGGGAVAARRLPGLVDAGANVVVISPDGPPEVPSAGVTVIERNYEVGDLHGAVLALACTSDPAVNEMVAADALRDGIWCVRADDAAASTAWVPAVASLDGVHVAVSGGGDPGRAVAIRDSVEALLRSGDLPIRRVRRSEANGRVVLVGGGPGDPDLMTLRGFRALLDADVVIHDRLSPGGVLSLLHPDIEVIDVGKSPGRSPVSQDEINALMVSRARDGCAVVRLKGGDPFVFGRGSEEVAACRATGVEVDVVPGLSSATAAPSLAGVPLTERGTAQLFTVASGHVAPGDPRSDVDWEALARSGGSLVLLMAVANLPAIAAALIEGGRSPQTAAAIVESASLPAERIVTTTLDSLARAEGAAFTSPAVVVVGDVAGFRPAGGDGSRS